VSNLLLTKGKYFFTPSYYKDTEKIDIIYRALSHKELLSLAPLTENNRNSMFTYQVCKFSIEDIEDLQGNKLTLADLPPDVIKEIANEVLEKSVFSDEQSKTLDLSLSIVMSEDMKGEAWDCEVCRKKKLDRSRNCGYRGELDKNSDFKMYVGTQVFTSCPIYFVDKSLANSAILAYNLWQNHILPDEGGFFDQTNFFVEASLKVEALVAEKEKREIEKMKKGK